MEILIALAIAIVSGVIVNFISKKSSNTDEVKDNLLSENIIIKTGTYNNNSPNNNVTNSFNETNNYDNKTTNTNYVNNNSENSEGIINLILILFAATMTVLLFAKYFLYINIAFVLISTLTYISTKIIKKKIIHANSDIEFKIALLDQLTKSTDLMFILLGTFIAIITRYYLSHFDIMFQANNLQSMLQLMLDNLFKFAPVFSAIVCYFALFLNLFRVIYRNLSIHSKLKLLKMHPDFILAPIYKSISTFVSNEEINHHKRQSNNIKSLIFMTISYVGIEILFYFIEMLN